MKVKHPSLKAKPIKAMQQTPQDPNQPSSHQGFVPDPAYAANDSFYGDQVNMEDVVTRIQRRNKQVSFGISAAIVGLILLILGVWAINNFKAEEIELVVAATQGESKAVVEKKTFVQSVRQKPSKPSSNPSSAITANTSSPISVPSFDIESPDIGSSFGNGFGGGGFGDGLG